MRNENRLNECKDLSSYYVLCHFLTPRKQWQKKQERRKSTSMFDNCDIKIKSAAPHGTNFKT